MKTEDVVIWFGYAIIGLLFGWMLTDAAWRSDCIKIGAHVSEGKVYICSPKVTP